MSYLRDVPPLGMPLVVDEARKRGWIAGDPDWINLGQGQPELGPLPGAPARITGVDLEPGDHGYGPVNGTQALREAVAAHYNRLYRVGKKPYAASNVAIVGGGRPALGRALAAIGDVTIGYSAPDYWAYEVMLAQRPARLAGSPADVGAFLMSNPRNPTGTVLHGSSLRRLVDTARAHGSALLLDEFYSHYIYFQDAPVSAASYVDDPDRDPVLLVDGLTKNFRYPGWRVGWVVGPADAINVLERMGAALDGGPSQLAQRAALAVLEPSYADAETSAIRREFRRKRDVMVDALRDMGIEVSPPDGTFYVWGRVPGDAMDFFSRALDARVITVPGHIFDLNPGASRTPSYHDWLRFSFGPPLAQVEEGLARLAKLDVKA